MNFSAKPFWVFLFFIVLPQFHSLCSSYPTPLNCTDTTRLCTSFLAFSSNQTLTLIQSMFDVLPNDVTVEGNGRDYLFIRKNCSCTSKKEYLTNTTYTVRVNGGSVHDLVVEAYNGLAFLPDFTREARAGSVVSLQLFCGCSSGLWNYLMSYVMRDGDSVASLASRFGVSMDSIERVNGIENPDNVSVGSLFYIPLNSAPGEPYPIENYTPPASVPVPVPSVQSNAENKAHFPYWWILGSLGFGLALLVVVVIFVCLRTSSCFAKTQENNGQNLDEKTSHKFQILRNTSFCCASGRSICCKSGDWKQTDGESSDRQMNVPKAMGPDVFDLEKPVVFTYEEILACTDGFSESNLIGHGTYGSVYYGLLREQEVAIKRMTATKTKEFLAEMKVLCKRFDFILASFCKVELIGYAASRDELFLIYEHAQKGSLRSHLHDPLSKGQTSLSWIMRLQIVLDAARGLEYIHEHTKPHYVHRDIKTSNILLDGAFRAKISDFGLAKLVGKTTDGEASVTKVVGTFGYLAPEYLRDGLATIKSDVYAFGVVLFEIISGKEAITRTEGIAPKNSERRSLVSIVATLAKQCVDDDPILRPDMKQVVISLSQILLSSVEWEATLAGNSQVFSGLVQGR
ncbi:hypothetical protein RHGRI_025035 [Rhododendron griersonianum]|uniref:LysM domain receptor-like kinase 3 n=1 Tax=Rhododendron griersonianum TaxID=479676 RepID=A0AAV6JC89_9ERIC|nr:hypothetical protein RHGRI_025035 [Rhododendron griersonianum]